jgi:hypothetical protein
MNQGGNNMPRLLLLGSLFLLVGASLVAESVRIGIVGAAELAGETNCEDFFDDIFDNPIVFPGLYWEVLLHHAGFGMTYLAKFKKISHENPLPSEPAREWYLDWIGSFDFRYHFSEESLFDPFLEFGIGCAGRVYLSCLENETPHYSPDNPLLLSIFFQGGGGIAFRFDYLHAGIKLLYRFINEPVPATWFDVYELYKIQGALFAGVSF